MNLYLYPDFFLMNLLKLIRKGESETLEFKQSFDKEAIISIGALANRRGGMVVIGVSDKGEIKGTSVGKETLPQWLNQIAQVTDPKLNPSFLIRNIESKTVVEIHIAEYPVKPVSVGGRCYVRSGKANRQLNPTQISELHNQSLNLSWDSYPAADKSLKDLDFERIKQYIRDVNKEGRRELKGKPQQIIQKLEFVKDSKPTWAGCLLFKKQNFSGSPYSTIRVARFKGQASIIDDNVIEGPILDQLDATIKAIKKNINVRYAIRGRIKREDIWDYPLEAIREAVLNAICHRDYRALSDIQIKIFDDRLQIWNPGTLPFNLTIEDLLSNQYISRPRNRVITQAFYELGEIERLGSGIGRILKACRKAKTPMPKLEEFAGGFNITFKKAKVKAGGDEYAEVIRVPERASLEKRVIDYIEKEGKITNADCQQKFNLTKRSATRLLTTLTKKGIIIKKGTTGKGTEYHLNKGDTKGTQRGHKGDKHMP